MKQQHSSHHGEARVDLSPANTSFGPGAGRALSLLLLLAGAGLVAAAYFLGYRSTDPIVQRQTLASYHVGFLVCVGLSLGALVFVMILQQVNAGWSALLRRQFENIMSMFGACLALFLPVILLSIWNKPLWKWMDHEAVANDPLFQSKASFLDADLSKFTLMPPNFYLRAMIYFATWLILSRFLYSYSTKQDISGDRWLTAKARRMSSYGLLLFALTSTFASFDWIMSLDYHFFSTMYGVYFFAGNVGAALSLVTLIVLALRRAGKLKGLVTEEHLHDMGKLLFAFCVFWAYIGFSQYFLIWYANLPEETAWFVRRREGSWSNGWMGYSAALAVGRFIVPFFVLMPRPWRRIPGVLVFMSLWILGFNCWDMFWQVRPQVNMGAAPVMFNWMDLVGAGGPLCLYFGLLIRKIATGPLIPLRDPRLPESLHHKNYV